MINKGLNKINKYINNNNNKYKGNNNKITIKIIKSGNVVVTGVETEGIEEGLLKKKMKVVKKRFKTNYQKKKWKNKLENNRKENKLKLGNKL